MTSIILQGGPFNQHTIECAGDPISEIGFPFEKDGEVYSARYDFITQVGSVGYYEFLHNTKLERVEPPPSQ